MQGGSDQSTGRESGALNVCMFIAAVLTFATGWHYAPTDSFAPSWWPFGLLFYPVEFVVLTIVIFIVYVIWHGRRERRKERR
jgi:hypothetical protein